MHHDCVEVFERNEDAATGVHATIEDGKAIVETALDGNPSARRHGLSVRFWCEHCDTKPLLTLAQHKGSTYLAWQVDEPEEEVLPPPIVTEDGRVFTPLPAYKGTLNGKKP